MKPSTPRPRSSDGLKQLLKLDTDAHKSFFSSLVQARSASATLYLKKSHTSYVVARGGVEVEVENKQKRSTTLFLHCWQTCTVRMKALQGGHSEGELALR